MLDENDNISSVEKQLEEIFCALNHKYFGNKLEKPVIVVKSDLRNYQKISTDKIWSSENCGYYEICISAGLLNKSIEDVVVAILHQCVHLWNAKCGIKDTSRAGMYHNKKFRESAESCGLKVEYNKNNGWSDITASQQLLDFIRCQKWNRFPLMRNKMAFDANNKHHRKYSCPNCRKSVRATKNVRILCMDCNLQMVEVE